MSKESITIIHTGISSHALRADYYSDHGILLISHPDGKVLPNVDTERRVHAAAGAFEGLEIALDPTEVRIFEVQPSGGSDAGAKRYNEILGITREWQGLTCNYEPASSETTRFLANLD